jgi:molecular chaperone GrpE
VSHPHDAARFARAEGTPKDRRDPGHGADEPDEERPRVTDRRRIDPDTGTLRVPVPPSTDEGVAAVDEGAATGPAALQVADLERQLAERTDDLQRVSADYANYRRRVDRDRAAVGEQALASVLIGLLPVLDDIERARAHGELVGGFQKVAEGLEATLSKLGLEAFGEAGEPFDPTVHEALMHRLSRDVTETTCVEVLQRGYRIGERVIRPARVAVADPEPAAPATPTSEDDDE